MKTILVISVLVIITTPYCYSAAIEDTATDTNTADDTTAEMHEMNIDFEAQTVNIIKENKNCDDAKGPQGIQGERGPPGPPGGGAIYTRWGRTVCPNTTGTELVYEGLVAGTAHSSHGGGANYLCLTKEITYLSTTVPSAHSLLYGGEYEDPVISSVEDDDNAPCAVCHTSQRSSKLMIPGTTVCPTSWTEEYEGYLMTELHIHEHNNNYECVDKDSEVVPGEGRNTIGNLLYHVSGVCNVGLPCPPVVANRPLTCVVCTK